MSKEDRYSHLGDGASREATDEQIADANADADTDAGTDADASNPEIRVAIDDGTETITLTVDAEDVSVDDLRDAIRAASDDGGASRTALPPDVRAVLSIQRFALAVGFLGPTLALNQAAAAIARRRP